MRCLTAVFLITLFIKFVSSIEVDPIIRNETLASGFDNPSGIFITSTGNFYLSNTLQQTIVNIKNGVSNTFAGVLNKAGYNGDGLSAQMTSFSNPYGIYSNDKYLYIADTWNQRVRSVDLSTLLTSTIAGNGECGSEGDGKSAVNSQLCNPQSIFQLNDNLYIADTYNDKIRLIKDNLIFTICGTVSGFGGDGGNANESMLDKPKSIFAINRNNQPIIYIADSNNNRIRKIENSIIETIAGGNEAGYNGDGMDARDALLCNPTCLYVREEGDVFICDYCNNRIRRILRNGTITSLPILVENPSGIYMVGNSLFISESSKGVVTNVTYSCEDGYFLADNLNCKPVCSCSPNGTCVAPGVCKCDEGYGGEYCQYHVCFGKVASQSCSSHGICVNFDKCQCQENYFGNECQLTSCFGKNSTDESVCERHGRCIAYNQCQCEANRYNGTTCQYPICGKYDSSNSRVCSSHGNCTEPSKCECHEGYTGTDCEFYICYGMNSNQSDVCSSHGSCVNPNECKCKEGYSGMMCQYPSCYGVNSTESNVCSGHGQCLRWNECSCLEGKYTGSMCELNICGLRNSSDPLVCSGHGYCKNPEDCQCNNGYNGQYCNNPICYGISSNETNVCSGHGYCTLPDTCQCMSNFTGIRCESAVCNGRNDSDILVCSGNGNCIHDNNSTRCKCRGLYVGNDCQYPTCLNTPSYDTERVCGGRGACTAPNTCACTGKKYDGIYCEFPTCYEKSTRDNTACSGFTHGSCESPDNCVCKSGNYTGLQCEIPICYGYTSSSRKVCSSRGICADANQCQCNEGYTGPNCEVPICYSIRADHPGVCSGRNGTCIDKDSCKCNSGYQGSQCEIPICGELPSIDPLSCGGKERGLCVAHNSCSCTSSKYYGDVCEHAICNGIGATDNRVCSGFGTCISFGKCECQIGKNGFDCQADTNTVIGLSVFGGFTLLVLLISATMVIAYFIKKRLREKRNRHILLNEMNNDLQILLNDQQLSTSYLLDESDYIPENSLDIGKKLGEGNFGSVFKAQYNGETVAIKLVRGDGLAIGDQKPDEFIREVSILRGLDHPNIVFCHGFTICKGIYSLVLEFVEYSLLGVMKRPTVQQHLNTRKKIQILIRIAEGLKYLHGRTPPVMHRDLKPANILVSADLEVIKICDFGMSARNISTGTTNLGTPYYMSPEIIVAKDTEKHNDGCQYHDKVQVQTNYNQTEIEKEAISYNEKVDIYSFGILMWELFFFMDPFTDKRIYDTLSEYFDDIPRLTKHQRTFSALDHGSGAALQLLQYVCFQNYRPFIPISGDVEHWLRKNRKEEYCEKLNEITIDFISLMKRCWHGNSKERPSSSELVRELSRIAKIFDE